MVYSQNGDKPRRRQVNVCLNRVIITGETKATLNVNRATNVWIIKYRPPKSKTCRTLQTILSTRMLTDVTALCNEAVTMKRHASREQSHNQNSSNRIFGP